MGGNLEHFPFIGFFPTETIAAAGAVVLEKREDRNQK